MTTWHWMRRLLLLAFVTSPCISIHFFPDSEFDGRPVTKEAADAFFQRLDEKISLRSKDLENSQRRDTLTPAVDAGFYRRSSPTNPTGMKGCFEADTVKQGYQKVKNTQDCLNIKINEFLNVFGTYDTLDKLSDDILNGNDYLMQYYKPGTGGKALKEVIAVNTASRDFTLTGVKMIGNTNRNAAATVVPTLTIDLHPRNKPGTTPLPPLATGETPGPQHVAITLSGRGNLVIQGRTLGNGQMAIPITLTKAHKKKVYDITYDTATGFQLLFQDLKKEMGFASRLAGYLDTFGVPKVKEYYQKVADVVDAVEEETQNYTLMATFNKDKAFQIQLSRGATPIDTDKTISQLSIIISFEDDKTTFGEAGYTFYGMADQGDLNLFELIGLAGDNFFTNTLSTLNSEKWCLLVTNKEVEYLGGRKTEVVNTCLGVPLRKPTTGSTSSTSTSTTGKRSVVPENTRDKRSTGEKRVKSKQNVDWTKQQWQTKQNPVPDPGMGEGEEEPKKGLDDNVLQPGAHFYLKVDFTAFLDKCWENVENQNIRTNFHIQPKQKRVGMYATITRDGITAQIKDGSEDLNDIMKNCAGGFLIGAPNWLTGGVVNVDNFQYKTSDKSLTVSVSVTPKEGEPLNIPGTAIGLAKLDFTVDRKPVQGNPSQFTIDIKGTTTIDIGGAPATVSLTKVSNKYTITAKIDSLTLANLFESIATSTSAPEILQTIGVENFLLNYEFGSNAANTGSSGANGQNSDFKLDVSGNPLILGFNGLTLGAIASRTGSTLKFSIGVHLANADFTSVMKNIGGPDAPSLKWLKGLEAVFIFSKGQSGTLTNQARRSVVDNKVSTTKRTVGGSTDAVVQRNRRSMKARKSKHTSVQAKHTSAPAKRASGGASKATGVKFVFQQANVFNDMKFVDGLTFGVSWTIPASDTSCEGNGVCKWLVEKLGGGETEVVFMITGAVTSTSFRLKASALVSATLFEKPGSKMTFKEVGLVLEVGTKLPKFMILAKIAFYNEDIGATGANELMFTGSIEATPVSIAMTFSMDGFIFFPSYVAIGDISLSIGLSFTSGLPTMVFGATIMFGKLTKEGDGTAIERNPLAITVEGRFGINPGYPSKNFFYARINKLTIDAICKAFDIDCRKVPPQIGQTGFPNGITISFAGEDITDVPGVGTISAGFYIKGTLNLLGYEVHCEIGKTKTRGWVIDIKMSPINIANGWIKIQKDENTPDEGPTLHAEFGGTANELEMSAYANALDIYKVTIKLCLSSTSTYFKVEGPLIPGLVYAYATFYMRYRQEQSAADNLFELTAGVKLDDFKDKLKEEVKKIIRALKALADAALKICEDMKEKADEKLRLAQREVDSWKEDIETWKQDLKRQKQALQKQAQSVPPCDPPCGMVCVPFLDWNPSCWKIWGVSVGCPYWNSCFTKVKDLFCLAKCAVNRVVSTLTRWAKQAILEISMLVAEGAKGLLKLADGVLGFATQVVASIGDTLAWMKTELDKLEKLGTDKVDEIFGMFDLKKLELTASITADFKPCLSYDIQFEFKPNPMYQSNGKVCLDWKSFLAAFVRLITGNSAGSLDVSEEKEKIEEAERKNSAGTNSLQELATEEKRAKDQIDEEEKKKFERKATTKRKRSEIPHAIEELRPLLAKLPKRTTPLTKDEIEIRELVKQPMPRYYIQDDPDVSMRSMIEEPWSSIKEGRPVGFNSTVHADPTIKVKRQLDFDESLSPCDRMKRALKGYSDLTDGLITYSRAIQDSTTGMQSAHDARAEQLNVLRSDIHAAENAHNMTMEDSDEAHLLYDKLNNGHKELTRKSHVAIEKEDSYALPIIRRQLNGFLKKANGKNFVQFTELMHVNAVKGYKRSGIPHPSDVEGENMLTNIKKDLQSIVTDESSSLLLMTPRLGAVKKHIIAMSSYTKQCRHE